jgi:hypothetical protein
METRGVRSAGIIFSRHVAASIPTKIRQARQIHQIYQDARYWKEIISFVFQQIQIRTYRCKIDFFDEDPEP